MGIQVAINTYWLRDFPFVFVLAHPAKTSDMSHGPIHCSSGTWARKGPCTRGLLLSSPTHLFSSLVSGSSQRADGTAVSAEGT